MLERYAAYMASRVSYNTIKVYLSGIQFHAYMAGCYNPISSMVRLYYLLRGIRRIQGSTFQRARRQPITTNHLQIISHRLQLLDYTPFQRLALLTTASVAFFGLLRCSEYTCSNSRNFDPLVDLMARNVTISENRSIMALRIKASKTDPFREGCTIRIGATRNHLCPVQLMHQYLSTHPFPQGPLFVMSGNQFMTRNDIVNLLSRCLPSTVGLNTHSFRIGGASAAASSGVPDSTIQILIQILGRWSSDAYRRYLHVSNDSIISLSRRLSQTSVLNRFWSQDSLSSLPR